MQQSIAKIIIGSDHAGFEMKEHIKSELSKLNIPYEDIGVYNKESSDYPVYAAKVARKVSLGEYKRGIIICGTGIGASITANRFRNVRAALCLTKEMSLLSRTHNNANILVLGGRVTPFDIASQILQAWLETDFAGGRHEKRIHMIDDHSIGM